MLKADLLFVLILIVCFAAVMPDVTAQEVTGRTPAATAAMPDSIRRKGAGQVSASELDAVPMQSPKTYVGTHKLARTRETALTEIIAGRPAQSGLGNGVRLLESDPDFAVI